MLENNYAGAVNPRESFLKIQVQRLSIRMTKTEDIDMKKGTVGTNPYGADVYPMLSVLEKFHYNLHIIGALKGYSEGSKSKKPFLQLSNISI